MYNLDNEVIISDQQRADRSHECLKNVQLLLPATI
jgi:hypothetical protein